MLFFNFKRIIKARGISKPFRYLLDQGFSVSFSTSMINNRTMRMDLETLEKLCVVSNCTPNELLEWVPDDPESDTPNHPLAPLKRTKVNQLNQLISKIPIDKLDSIESLIRKERE